MTNYIQSIQQVSITIASGATSNTATINSVTTANVIIDFSGCEASDTANSGALGKVILTNGTTVTATRNTGSATTCTVKCTVVEFVSAAINVAAQFGTIALSAVSSNTATITSVTTGNASLFFLGWSYTGGTWSTATYVDIALTNGTTVTAARTTGTGTINVSFCVVEWTTAVVKTSQHRSVTWSTGSTTTDTITSVATGNTLLLFGGIEAGSSAPNSNLHYLTLTNGTTVTLTRSGTSATTKTVKYNVLEFQSGVLAQNVQRGTIALNNVTSNTATITSVTTSQAFVNYCGYTTANSGTAACNQELGDLTLTNGTTVTAGMNTADTNILTISYEVAEFAVGGIAFDAASNSGYQTAQSTYSWNHTVTGSNTYLTVGIAMLSVAGSSVSSITFNGVAMAFLGAKASVSGAVRAELWGLVAPAAGTHSIAVTLTTALDSAGGAVSYTGVNQVISTEALNSASATNVGAADATVSITTIADSDWVVDITASDDTAITVGTGNTSRSNVTGTLGSGAIGDTNAAKTPAGSQTMSWTNVGALATWSIVGVALRPIGSDIFDFMPFF